MKYTKEQILWIILRLAMGLTFFWPFFDKLFGLGFSTCRDTKTQVVTYMCKNAWLNGGSPTKGYLGGSVGPLADFYKSIAGAPLTDWLFMVGLFAVGLAILLGVGMKIAGYSGAVMVLLMLSSHYPPTTSPLFDQHLLEALVLLLLTTVKAGQWLGLGKWWVETSLVKKMPYLE